MKKILEQNLNSIRFREEVRVKNLFTKYYNEACWSSWLYSDKKIQKIEIRDILNRISKVKSEKIICK